MKEMYTGRTENKDTLKREGNTEDVHKENRE
jgi:hypothetical protein